MVTCPFPLEQDEAVIFFLAQAAFDVTCRQFFSAIMARTRDREVSSFNLRGDVLFDALNVVDVVAAIQDYDFITGIICEETIEAYIAKARVFVLVTLSTSCAT